MDTDLIATLSGITGLPTDQAAMYLEMSGGNLDMAVSIFFDGGGGGGGGSMGADGQGAGSSDVGAFDAPTPAHALLFGPSPAPSSWADQGFEWHDATCVGLTQRANGPCGILAAVNAEVRIVRAHGVQCACTTGRSRLLGCYGNTMVGGTQA